MNWPVFWDMIQPGFMYIVGVAMPFAFAARRARGQTRPQMFKHVWKRSLSLLLIGMAIVCVHKDTLLIDLTTVLQQIAIAYFFAFFVLERGLKVQALVTLGILLVHWACFQFWPGVGPDGPWAKNANFAAASDVPQPSDANPADVGSAPLPGASDDFSRADHVHRGVASLAKSGGAAKYGDITLSEGDNVTITVTDNDFEIAADAGVTSFDSSDPESNGPYTGAIKLYYGQSNEDDPIVIYDISGQAGYPATGAFEVLFASSYFPKAEIVGEGGARPLNEIFTNLKFDRGLGIGLEWADVLDDDDPTVKIRLATFDANETWSMGSGLGFGNRITGSDDPVNPADLANKHYVDTQISNIDVKEKLEGQLGGSGDGILVFDDDTDTISVDGAGGSGNLLQGTSGGAWTELEHPGQAGKVIQTTASGWEFIDTPSGGNGLPAGTAGDLLRNDGTGWQSWGPGNNLGALIYCDTNDEWDRLDPPASDGGLLAFGTEAGLHWQQGTSAGDILFWDGDNWVLLSAPGDDGEYLLRCTVSGGSPTFDWVEAKNEFGHFLPEAPGEYDQWLRYYYEDGTGYPMWDSLP